MKHINNTCNNKKPLNAPVLGAREIETLNLFWQQQAGSLSASDILNLLTQRAVNPRDVISLNTIQSTIERLWKKNLLRREKQGKAYIYTSLYSKQEVISSLIMEISDALGEGDDSAIMSGIFTFLKTKNTKQHFKMLASLEANVHLKV